MRKKAKVSLSVSFLVLGSLLVSCATTKITLEKETAQRSPSIALLQVMIAPPEYPLFPLMDAGIYRSAAEEKSREMTAIHKGKIDAYTDYLGQELSELSGSNILYGTNLIQSSAYRNLPARGVPIFPKTIDHGVSPEMIMQEGYYNFFDFSKVKNPFYYFDKEDADHSQTIATICDTLAVDSLAFCIMNVNTTVVGAFGITGSKMFQMKLYYFRKDGTQILKGSLFGKPVKSEAADIAKYEAILDEFYTHTQSLLDEIYGR